MGYPGKKAFPIQNEKKTVKKIRKIIILNIRTRPQIIYEIKACINILFMAASKVLPLSKTHKTHTYPSCIIVFYESQKYKKHTHISHDVLYSILSLLFSIEDFWYPANIRVSIFIVVTSVVTVSGRGKNAGSNSLRSIVERRIQF